MEKTRKLLTLYQVYKANGVRREDVLPYSQPKDDDQRSINAYANIKQITKAYNGDTTLDWDNTSQPKYYLYFIRQSGG